MQIRKYFLITLTITLLLILFVFLLLFMNLRMIRLFGISPLRSPSAVLSIRSFFLLIGLWLKYVMTWGQFSSINSVCWTVYNFKLGLNRISLITNKRAWRYTLFLGNSSAKMNCLIYFQVQSLSKLRVHHKFFYNSDFALDQFGALK